MTQQFSLIHLTNHRKEDHTYMVEHGDTIKVPHGGYFILGDKSIVQWRGTEKRSTTHLSKNIVATTDKSLNLPLLPAIEEDIEKLAKNYFQSKNTKFGSPAMEELAIMDWINGYKAASKRKYSEEDMRKAWLEGIAAPNGSTFEGFLQSLSPLPTAIEVDCEQNCPFDFTSRCTMGRCDCELKSKVDKTNTIIGRYIWEK